MSAHRSSGFELERIRQKIEQNTMRYQEVYTHLVYSFPSHPTNYAELFPTITLH